MANALSTPLPAPLFRRFGALVYDTFIVFSFWILLTALALLLNSGQSLLPYRGFFWLYLFVTTGALLSFFWCKKAQTPGMAAWRLVLLTSDNKPLTRSQAWRRYFFACMSVALLGMGFLWCLLDKNKQTLHDRLTKTAISQSIKSFK